MKPRPKIEDYSKADIIMGVYDGDLKQWAEEAEQELKVSRKDFKMLLDKYEGSLNEIKELKELNLVYCGTVSDLTSENIITKQENKELTINLRSKSDTLEADALVIRNRDKQIKELRELLEESEPSDYLTLNSRQDWLEKKEQALKK